MHEITDCTDKCEAVADVVSLAHAMRTHAAFFRATAPSTADWQALWRVERVHTATDWPSLLRQHWHIFRQLCALHRPSS
jgi:hypothetical protein